MNRTNGNHGAARARATDLPEPHRCPWWMQYVLASPLRRLTEPPARLLGPFVRPGMTVVDVGCGFGYVSLAVARQVGPHGRVVSLDVDPRVVARLQARARKAGLADRIEARVCAPADLGLGQDAGKVDLVTVIHTLHELADLPEFLGQVATLLAPGGRMLVVEPPGHVKPEHFAAEMRVCREAGFRELDLPAGSRKRQVAWLAPPTSPRPSAHAC